MKRTLLITISLIAALSLGGCSKGQIGETITIGWFGPLSGDQAVWGENELNAVKLIFDEYNLKGGLTLGGKSYRLVAVGYDNKGNPLESVNVVKRLVEQDKVAAIIGPNSSDCAIAAAPIIAAAKIPDIATAATNPAVTAKNGVVRSYEFRACFTDVYQSAVAAGFAYDSLKSRRAAILYESTSLYSTGLNGYFKKSFEKKGGAIVADESFKAGETDLKSQLQKIAEAKPDLIFLPYYSKEVAMTAIQARDLSLRQILLGADGWPSDQFIAMGGAALEGSYYVDHLDYSDPEAKKFADQYRTKYGKDARLNAYLAHDAVALLFAAMIKSGNPEPQDIARALNGIEVGGITGNLRISPSTHDPIGSEAVVFEIRGGKYIPKQKYSAQ